LSKMATVKLWKQNFDLTNVREKLSFVVTGVKVFDGAHFW
jgi:hypothetical protein